MSYKTEYHYGLIHSYFWLINNKLGVIWKKLYLFSHSGVLLLTYWLVAMKINDKSKINCSLRLDLLSNILLSSSRNNKSVVTLTLIFLGMIVLKIFVELKWPSIYTLPVITS